MSKSNAEVWGSCLGAVMMFVVGPVLTLALVLWFLFEVSYIRSHLWEIKEQNRVLIQTRRER